MSQTLITVGSGIAYIIKNVTSSSFVLLTANFTTGVVSSSILPSGVTTELTRRLQQLLAAVPVKADVENGFAGMVRSLVVPQMMESGSFSAVVTYVAPTATYTMSSLADPSHLAITIPQSTSAPFIGNP